MFEKAQTQPARRITYTCTISSYTLSRIFMRVRGTNLQCQKFNAWICCEYFFARYALRCALSLSQHTHQQGSEDKRCSQAQLRQIIWAGGLLCTWQKHGATDNRVKFSAPLLFSQRKHQFAHVTGWVVPPGHSESCHWQEWCGQPKRTKEDWETWPYLRNVSTHQKLCRRDAPSDPQRNKQTPTRPKVWAFEGGVSANPPTRILDWMVTEAFGMKRYFPKCWCLSEKKGCNWRAIPRFFLPCCLHFAGLVRKNLESCVVFLFSIHQGISTSEDWALLRTTWNVSFFVFNHLAWDLVHIAILWLSYENLKHMFRKMMIISLQYDPHQCVKQELTTWTLRSRAVVDGGSRDSHDCVELCTKDESFSGESAQSPCFRMCESTIFRERLLRTPMRRDRDGSLIEAAFPSHLGTRFNTCLLTHHCNSWMKQSRRHAMSSGCPDDERRTSLLSDLPRLHCDVRGSSQFWCALHVDIMTRTWKLHKVFNPHFGVQLGVSIIQMKTSTKPVWQQTRNCQNTSRDTLFPAFKVVSMPMRTLHPAHGLFSEESIPVVRSRNETNLASHSLLQTVKISELVAPQRLFDGGEKPEVWRG